MAYLNGKPILFSPHVYVSYGVSEEELQAAREAERDVFWDMFQSGGERTDYNSAFRNWSAEELHPKYKIVPTGVNSCSYTFENNKNLKKIEAQYFDFSQKATGTNANTGYYNTFIGCSELVEIEDIGLIAQYNYQQTFYNCKKLKTIAKMGVDKNTKFSNPFYRCDELENLTIDGTIGQNDFSVRHCTKLSQSSIESIINALSDDIEHLATLSGTPTVTLSKTAVNNAFSVVDCLVGAVYAESQTKDGLTITNNGDGSFTLNGTYEGVEGWFFEAATIDLPFVKSGTYILSLESDSTNDIQDIYTHGGLSLMQGENTLAEPNGDTIHMNLVIGHGATFHNITIRPTLVYDEWKSLIYHIGHFWTITLL